MMRRMPARYMIEERLGGGRQAFIVLAEAPQCCRHDGVMAVQTTPSLLETRRLLSKRHALFSDSWIQPFAETYMAHPFFIPPRFL